MIVCDSINPIADKAIKYIFLEFPSVSSYKPFNNSGKNMLAEYSPKAFLEYIFVNLYGNNIYINAEQVAAILFLVIFNV